MGTNFDSDATDNRFDGGLATNLEVFVNPWVLVKIMSQSLNLSAKVNILIVPKLANHLHATK
jgi:hypothetical protein